MLGRLADAPHNYDIATKHECSSMLDTLPAAGTPFESELHVADHPTIRVSPTPVIEGHRRADARVLPASSKVRLVAPQV